MSLDALRASTEGTFQAWVNANAPGTPIRFQNVPFVRPSDAPFFTFHILDMKTWTANLGSQKIDRHIGTIFIDYAVPPNTGTSAANQMISSAGFIWRYARFLLPDGSSVKFHAPDIHQTGDLNGMFVVSLRMIYTRDEKMQ